MQTIYREQWKNTFTLFQIARTIYNSIKNWRDWNMVLANPWWLYEIKIRKTKYTNWKQVNTIILDDKL